MLSTLDPDIYFSPNTCYMPHYTRKDTLVNDQEMVGVIRQWACPLDSKAGLQPLFDRIGDARIVMLGEASHGTHEYYTWRAHISRKLITEKGFNCIAVEGDWPDCYRLNRFVKGYDKENKSAFKVMHEFNRWPTWMWANWETVALADWLHAYNKDLPAGKKAGFYGLDVYSLWESMASILDYLERTDKEAWEMAREAYQCFEPYRKDEGRSYGHATQFVPELCQDEVVELLKNIRHKLPQFDTDPENAFNAEQNALVMVHAEEYYRTLIRGGPHSWNLRDRHMAETLDRLLAFHGPGSKIIVWAHNTHIGDARATDMVKDGMYNMGELARVNHARDGVVLVGFGSYDGTVIAAKSWGAPAAEVRLPEARKGSWEYILRQAGRQDKLLLMEDFSTNDAFMENPIGHRAIGVVYQPRYERYSNYIPTILPLRYDAFIYLDRTKALYPLHAEPDGRQVPETYPFGV